MRNRQVSCIFRRRLQQRCLEVAFDSRFGAVDDLQNVAAAITGIDLEVSGPLAVQRLKVTHPGQVLCEEGLRFLES